MAALYVLIALIVFMLCTYNAWRLFKPSKIAQDVIDNLYSNPEDWRPISYKSIFGEWCRDIENQKIGIQIRDLGNSRTMTVCKIYARLESSGKYSELREIGSMSHVEDAALKWFKTAPLEAIAKA